LTEVQNQTYEDVKADAIEHAEHIVANGGNIAHQREHFVLLSKDIYDLVKEFGGGQVLYWNFDSMYIAIILTTPGIQYSTNGMVNGLSYKTS
jgi:hypothetical protein